MIATTMKGQWVPCSLTGLSLWILSLNLLLIRGYSASFIRIAFCTCFCPSYIVHSLLRLKLWHILTTTINSCIDITSVGEYCACMPIPALLLLSCNIFLTTIIIWQQKGLQLYHNIPAYIFFSVFYLNFLQFLSSLFTLSRFINFF